MNGIASFEQNRSVSPHVPLPIRGMAASACTAPLPMSNRLSASSAMKAKDRPSGDQNGRRPLSVPASGRAASESSARSHSCPSAANTSFCPSGDSANEVTGPAGAMTCTRISAAGCGARDRYPIPAAATSSNDAAAIDHASHAGPRRDDTAGSCDCAVVCIHCNSRRTSRAVCQRSSGFLARHAETTRSIASGVRG
jgi:hypothetical protein